MAHFPASPSICRLAGSSGCLPHRNSSMRKWKNYIFPHIVRYSPPSSLRTLCYIKPKDHDEKVNSTFLHTVRFSRLLLSLLRCQS